MPELPEVEITRRHLARALEGRTLVEVSVRHERTARHNSSPEEVQDRLTDRTVVAVGRTGKFLRIELDDGQSMVAHLGMSGRWVIQGDEQIAHTHFEARLDDGTVVEFVDPRTFGFVAVYDQDEVGESGLARLGPDAWEAPPEPSMLHSSLSGRTAPIKALLLDQGPISGLGNIYADEALHLSHIHPLRPGGSLTVEEAAGLLAAIRLVLERALDSGGTTLADLAYLLPDGRAGENMAHLWVYGREGEPCRNCGTSVEKVTIRARSSHFCPSCQPAP